MSFENDPLQTVATEIKDADVVATAKAIPSDERLKEVYNIICGNLVGDDIRDVMDELANRGLVKLLKFELHKQNKLVMMEHENNTDLSLVVNTSKLNVDALSNKDYWEIVPDKTFSGGRKSKKQRNFKKQHKSKKHRK
jgi:hypothetical protein